MVGQTLRPPPNTAERKARVDTAGAEGAALPGDHLLPGQGRGEEYSHLHQTVVTCSQNKWDFSIPPQMWEKAIELGKQLARMHESHMFDFMELSELLVRGHAHSSRGLGETGRRHHTF